MQVVLTHWYGPTQQGQGELIDLPEDQAKAMIRAGGARPVGVAAETAVTPPPEKRGSDEFDESDAITDDDPPANSAPADPPKKKAAPKKAAPKE